MRDVQRYAWSNKKTPRKKPTNSRVSMASPDLTILFCEDAKEWDRYLTQTFLSCSGPQSISINHERLETLVFPLPSVCAQSFTSAKAVLIIMSPASLEFIDGHAEVFELGKLLRPNQTVAMLCGIDEGDISPFHKAALVSYDAWPRLIARDQDRECVENVIETTFGVLNRAQESRAFQKAQFKVSPRKIKEGNGKVFVILDRAIRDDQKVQIILEGNGVKEMPVKRRNPYTLQFVVPDGCMQVCKLLNVHVKCDDFFLGVRALKCESKMGELFTLLQSVNSPYEMLRQTMGVASCSEVDNLLVKNFQRNLPSNGFKLLDLDINLNQKSEEELPTLLHFAARYGLRELTSQLLQCSGAAQACKLQNVNGFSPAQLANQEGHNDIAGMLEDYQKLTESDGFDSSADGTMEAIYECMQDNEDPESHIYDVPFPVPIPSIFGNLNDVPVYTRSMLIEGHVESHYLEMASGYKPQNSENLEPHEKVLLGIEEDKKNEKDEQVNETELRNTSTTQLSSLNESANHRELIALSTGQKELLDILESYKKGARFSEVEKLFLEWQMHHIVPSENSIEGLKKLREIYKRAKKQKYTKRQTKNFFELQTIFSSKLGRKDVLTAKQHQSMSSVAGRKDGQKENEDILQQRISTLSTLSFTSSSSSSSIDGVNLNSNYDSGNDSCDDLVRSKEDITVRKMVSVNGQTNRPPVPPPRPQNLRKLSIQKSSSSKSSGRLVSHQQKLNKFENLTYKNIPPVMVPNKISSQTTASEENSESIYYNSDAYYLKTKHTEFPENSTKNKSCTPTPPLDMLPSGQLFKELNEQSHRKYRTPVERTNSERFSRKPSGTSHMSVHYQLSTSDSCPALNLSVSAEDYTTKASNEKMLLHRSDELHYVIPPPPIAVVKKHEESDVTLHSNHDYAIPRKPEQIGKICKEEKRINKVLVLPKPVPLNKDSDSELHYYNLLPSKGFREIQLGDDMPDEPPPPPPVDDLSTSLTSSGSPFKPGAPPLPPRGMTAPRPQMNMNYKSKYK
ncbi:phosphoinositide 3-kinase adapter protein 1-like isoform X3 [Limulus polyphemus]|uniref:Phosphoinositide 3-kinase adapter protein 1-like isoform X3 n=1 Tax=Limulus polyphemus TaxID=6850 RepID=A0ABM1BBG3_LIMPO|nr:phosphoinositide 3-kinase adapter protein 1-like isoform X3 [Limulus polyphemus]